MTDFSTLLILIPILPLISAIILILFKPEKKLVTLLGIGSVATAAVFSLLLQVGLWQKSNFVITASMGNWINLEQLNINFGLYLDPISLLMISIITGVGLLIHLFSHGFMNEDKDYQRYFAYLNLFVSAMLILVLADNLLLLYLGWEGVGLCSYLLIGFWHKEQKNNLAANKAFLITRIGDTAMALGIFLLFYQLGTLNIQQMQDQANILWQTSSGSPDTMAFIACILLLGGAVGKSAQFPLQNWLPDAMAGPTPVSALIHAATMVTAGVYLIARHYPLFQLVPDVLYIIALVGTFTLILAATSAMVQSDLKRILAYSTISQIGYLFLALGVSAPGPAMFHLMTHAFFKALLFLSAGAIIYCLHHEHNIFKLGGLLKKTPLISTAFIIGGGALASLPFTSGFFSKELILANIIYSGHKELWWVATFGAFITAFYSARLFFVVFMGPLKLSPDKQLTNSMKLALVILIMLALFGGFQPELSLILPAQSQVNLTHLEHWLPILTPFIAISLAWWLFKKNIFGATITVPAIKHMHTFLKNGWQFDFIYHQLFVRPFCWLCKINTRDVIDMFYRGLELVSFLLHEFFTYFQNGKLRSYNTSLILFSILAIGWMLMI